MDRYSGWIVTFVTQLTTETPTMALTSILMSFSMLGLRITSAVNIAARCRSALLPHQALAEIPSLGQGLKQLMSGQVAMLPMFVSLTNMLGVQEAARLWLPQCGT